MLPISPYVCVAPPPPQASLKKLSAPQLPEDKWLFSPAPQYQSLLRFVLFCFLQFHNTYSRFSDRDGWLILTLESTVSILLVNKNSI